ncbi:MAG: plasmid recombination protein [Oscillospiraceae bacterium]|nr:plasmid recombination protein [Oscillospiraceae bacterium]
MAHMNKYARSAVGQLCQHYERKKKEDGEYVKFGNEDIDLTKTHLNYNLAPQRSLKNQIEFINQRCSEVKCLNRKDVNVMVSWVVTQPKDFPKERSREFFEKTYEFLNTRYGGDESNEQNVISAYVHLDEKSAHMHYAFVPVVADKKSGKPKVSAKEAISKGDLLTFHKDLEKHLYEHFGFEVGIINGATKEGNLSIKALKLKSEVDGLVEKKKNLQAGVQHYEDLAVAIDDVSNIGTKSLIGKNISVPPDKYALMQEQSKAFRVNKDKIENIDKLEKSAKMYEDWAKTEWLDVRQAKSDCEQERMKVNDLYKQQLNLNKSHEWATRRIRELTQEKKETTDKLKEEMRVALEKAAQQRLSEVKIEKERNDTLNRANADLSSKNASLLKEKADKDKEIAKLKQLNLNSNTGFADVVCALGTLENSENRSVIKGIRDCAVRWLREDGHPDLADMAQTEVGISDSIQKRIDVVVPQVRFAKPKL